MDALVLLSGGIASATTLALAASQARVKALTIDDGRPSGRREIEAARALAAHLGVEHEVLALPLLASLAKTPDAAPPNRMGILLALGAAGAEACGARQVLLGFHRGTAARRDGAPEMLTLGNAALAYSSATKVKLRAPLASLTPEEVLAKARSLGLPLELCVGEVPVGAH